MSTGREDDALSWSGDDDPTLDVGAADPHAKDAAVVREDVATPPLTPPGEPLPDGYAAVGKGSAEYDASVAAAEAAAAQDARVAEPVPAGNAALVSLGLLGGIYLLYTIGWIIGGLRLEGVAVFLIDPLAFQFGFWLAVLAPVVWFGTVFLLTRHSKMWIRIAWLIGGVALLVPWPFIMTGAVGQ